MPSVEKQYFNRNSIPGETNYQAFSSRDETTKKSPTLARETSFGSIKARLSNDHQAREVKYIGFSILRSEIPILRHQGKYQGGIDGSSSFHLLPQNALKLPMMFLREFSPLKGTVTDFLEIQLEAEKVQ